MGLERNLGSWDQIFAAIQGGEFSQELRRQRNELIAALQEHYEEHRGGAKGSITIKLDFKLEKGGATAVRASVKVEPPKAPPAQGVFWTQPGGGLSLVNPAQLDMGFGSPRVIEDEPRTPPTDDTIRTA